MRAILTALFILISFGRYISAGEISDSATIHFRQSRSVLEPHYKNNYVSLDSMSHSISEYARNDSLYSLTSVRVVGAASPEGSVAINRSLSEKRAARIFNYFSEKINLPDSLVKFDFVGRDWSGLYRLVSGDMNVPYRVEVLDTISQIIASIQDCGSDNAHNLEVIKSMHSGVPYAYMYRNMFPQLRESRLYVDYQRRYSPLAQIPLEKLILVDPIPGITYPPVHAVIPVERERRPFYMALKTNMLFDALALPNIGAEFYLGKQWSVAANWMYAWWDNDHSHRYWRAYGGDLTVRRWFGHKAAEKPLTGHHIGAYAGVVTYDFEFGGKGYMGGLPHRTLWDRCNVVAGIEYGYSLPIARRLNIDFTIGVGYMGGKYLVYVPEGSHYKWQSTHRLNWFGPTKAEISLVWLLGHGNYNNAKGGKR